MKIIYLASDSKARKKILQDFGLKFKVLPSHIRESRSKGSLSFSGLAQKNALEKAKAAGKKVKSGLIIAADTFVVQGKTIFGKPKDIKDARRMLKKISRKPQWLYTGIAVIDKDRKKTLVGCEKTKIYMDPLNDKEISAYFAQVNPLDKAGSFDIQGRGAFFIRRIEGCFYNVVGLPVYKLFKMLQKLGVVLYCALFVLSVMLAG